MNIIIKQSQVQFAVVQNMVQIQVARLEKKSSQGTKVIKNIQIIMRKAGGGEGITPGMTSGQLLLFIH